MCLIYLSTTYSATCVILFFFLMIRRPPRSTLFPYTSSSDLSLENMSITPPSGSVLFWGVSQGISFRRMEVNGGMQRSEEHTSELQSLAYLVCRLLLEKKKK